MDARSKSSSPVIRRRSSLHDSEDRLLSSSTLPPPPSSLSTSSTSSSSTHPSSTASSSSQQTPLPSIRSLHPYLPPTSAQHHPIHRELSLRDLQQHRDNPRPLPSTTITPSFGGSVYAPLSASPLSASSPYPPYAAHSPRIHPPPPHPSPNLVGVAGPGPARHLSGPGGPGPAHVTSSSSSGVAGLPIHSVSTISLSYGAGVGSDGEDVSMEGPSMAAEHSEQLEQPNKKKRRRQALSCTECKRRKIKCDRNQPCSPCTRRGEQSKCQWHIVESANDKYVLRAEYDELRARVDKLESLIMRLTGSEASSLLAEGFGRSEGDGRSGGRSPDSNTGNGHSGHGHDGGNVVLGRGSGGAGSGRGEAEGREGGTSLGTSGSGSGSGFEFGSGFRGGGGVTENKFHVDSGEHRSGSMGHSRSSSGGTSISMGSGGIGSGVSGSVKGYSRGNVPGYKSPHLS